MKHSFLKSVQCSTNGLKQAFCSERNFRLQLIAACSVVILGVEARLSRTEWIVLLLSIALVLCLELFNTCIEKIMDLVHPHHSEKVKHIKDMAAAAVWVAALCSAVVGLLLFYPHYF